MEEKKEKLSLALLFSFLVALAGSIVWGIVYSSGWLVAVVAYLTTFGCFMVYLKFAKMSKLTFVWTLVWVIVLNIIATFVSIVVSVSLQAHVSIIEAFNAFVSVIGEPEVIGSLITDIILGIVFSVLGVVCYYIYYKKRKQAQKLEQARREAFTQQVSTQETVEQEDEVKEGEIVSTESLEDKQ